MNPITAMIQILILVLQIHTVYWDYTVYTHIPEAIRNEYILYTKKYITRATTSLLYFPIFIDGVYIYLTMIFLYNYSCKK